ncbi:MAG: fused MFS/spermidine synthase [bacterium]|nr:fused MFS/spermidine synthase [bacterium]
MADRNMRRYALEFIVFISGAVVMVLEIVGTRLIAPYFGTSLPIWTTIISIVLASLSLGYYYGGRLADRGATYRKLSFLLLAAGVFVGLTMILQNQILFALGSVALPFILRAALAVFILLAPAAILLGVISPYAVRLRIDSVSTSGSTVGRLSALSATGSILGTFLAGLVLLQFLGSNNLLLVLAITLLILALVAYQSRRFVICILVLMIILVAASFGNKLSLTADLDTAYNRVWVFDKGNVRTLSVGGVSESAMYLDGSSELVFPYTRFYRLARHFASQASRALMLGGAGYSYPRDFLKNFTEATIDVVEIDPGMTEIARNYFNLTDDPRLRIIHEDGRVFINRTENQYDVFFGDAFGSFVSVPYQLTTREAAEKIFGLLSDDGVAIINLIGSIEGETGKFVRAEYLTYQELFPQVYLLPVQSSDASRVQNIMLIALKNNAEPQWVSANAELNNYLRMRWTSPIAKDVPVLTDDFAPVDQYMAALLD